MNNIKDYSRKISEHMWNLPDKGELVCIAKEPSVKGYTDLDESCTAVDFIEA